jgi:hypothetical protein
MTFGVTEDKTVTCGVELPANARPGITYYGRILEND